MVDFIGMGNDALEDGFSNEASLEKLSEVNDESGKGSNESNDELPGYSGGDKDRLVLRHYDWRATPCSASDMDAANRMHEKYGPSY
jgi:hypothetical protein